jgi:hypothetical protein
MAAETKENGKKAKKVLSKGTLFNIALLGIIAFGIYFCYYGLYASFKNIYPTNCRIAETLYTICHPIKEQYDIKDYHVKPFGDGSMGVEYIINNPELAFDIVREIDTLRKDSIYLSRALLHIRIRSAQPGGVDFRVELPGEYGYESKRDDELYRKLDGNIQRFQWQEFRKTIREKYPESEESDADTAGDTDADRDADADTAPDATPKASALPGDAEPET